MSFSQVHCLGRHVMDCGKQGWCTARKPLRAHVQHTRILRSYCCMPDSTSPSCHKDLPSTSAPSRPQSPLQAVQLSCSQLFAGTNLGSSAKGGEAALLLLLSGSLLLAALEPSNAHAAAEAIGGPEFHPQTADLLQLAAGEDDFWGNVAQYGRFFITVMVGTGYVILKPIAELLKRPVTAVFVIAGAIGLFLFVKFTVSAMLGITDPLGYAPLNFDYAS